MSVDFALRPQAIDDALPGVFVPSTGAYEPREKRRLYHDYTITERIESHVEQERRVDYQTRGNPFIASLNGGPKRLGFRAYAIAHPGMDNSFETEKLVFVTKYDGTKLLPVDRPGPGEDRHPERGNQLRMPRRQRPMPDRVHIDWPPAALYEPVGDEVLATATFSRNAENERPVAHWCIAPQRSPCSTLTRRGTDSSTAVDISSMRSAVTRSSSSRGASRISSS